jgi:ABC-type polysaccharide/polyol phosphate transport system ATPase subunit
MQSRLSFALGMVFPADIYCFDEVLAVIDGEFRDRCLGQIGALAQAGATVFFTSHDLEQVQRLCGRVLWLDRGELRDSGPPADVLSSYRQAHHG